MFMKKFNMDELWFESVHSFLKYNFDCSFYKLFETDKALGEGAKSVKVEKSKALMLDSVQ